MLWLDLKKSPFGKHKKAESCGKNAKNIVVPSVQVSLGLTTIPQRDRSRSLCVERGISLLPPAGIANKKAWDLHRRRASAAVSSSSDLISRRGVFSRRHYGSVELLPQIDVEGSDLLKQRRFRIENGESVSDELYSSPSTPVLENPEYQTRWYFKYFLGKLHQNYVGADSEKMPFFLSVVLTDASEQSVSQYRVILWKRKGAQKFCMPYTPNKPMTVKQILSNFPNMDKMEKGPKEIFNPEIQKDLLLLEEQEGSVNFKFGILCMKAGQTSDDAIFSNEVGSSGFDKFVNLLGEKIRLKSWDKFRGGLDIKGDMTGMYSTYTIYEGHEIMFHVATLLPYSKNNKQQVERKRHIGNDIVNIVFFDGQPDDMAQFNPSFIKSQFTHIFAVVCYVREEDAYRINIYSEESVPLFGPSLPCPPVFHNHQEFREFLLVKLINGEKATFNSPTFAKKRERTLDMLIKDMFNDHMNDSRGQTMLNRRAFSDVLPEAPRGSRRKEEARQVEFVRIGQALKLDTIVKGDAPTSMATTGMFRRAPWEPLCFYPDFPQEVVCGDSWGDNRVFIGSETGVYLVEDGGSQRLVFDRSFPVKQISVVEAHGIILFRAEKGRDCKVYVFRLSDFDLDPPVSTTISAGGEIPANRETNKNGNNIAELPVRTKQDARDHKLEKTKGCHIYATSRPGGSHLRMVVAVGRKLLLMQWRHSAAWTAWCPASDSDTVDGFQYIREIQVPETPALLTLVDSSIVASAGGASDNNICIGYKHSFDLVNEKTGEVSRLHSVDGNKVHLVAAVDIYEDDEAELLLCYNSTCHFQKLTPIQNPSSEFDFQWNSVPEAIVCAFPYILAFTSDSIEIRLIINGNLVQCMIMPKLKMITSKNDIYFTTTAPEFFQVRRERVKADNLERDPSLSPPSSPHSPDSKPYRIYRIPLNFLSGATSSEQRCPTPTPNPIPEGSTWTGQQSGGTTPSPASMEVSPIRRRETHLRVFTGEPATGLTKGRSRSCTASPTPNTGEVPKERRRGSDCYDRKLSTPPTSPLLKINGGVFQ